MNTTNYTAPVFYEVNIRQYTPEGTFTAFMEHLPRLQEMGMQVIWLMPIHPIGIKNRKGTLGSYYSISDFESVNPEFGTINDFKLLIEEAHHYGLKVIIDWVANHTAWDHKWITTNPDFYAKNETGENFAPFDWEDVVQLDHSNLAQQAAMAEAMNFWVEECNIDGFRCDMAHLTPLATWRLAKPLCETKKKLIWLAETEDESYFEIFDIIYGWEWLHACNAFAKGEADINKLIAVLNRYKHLQKIGKSRLLFTTNHDENSWNGTEFERLGYFAQLLTALSWLAPGVPLIYSGQEAPLTKSLAFFEKDTIDWNNYKASSFISSLAHILVDNKCFINKTEADFEWINTTEKQHVISFMYHYKGKKIIVVANLSIEKLNCSIVDNKVWAKYKEVFCIKKGVSEQAIIEVVADNAAISFENPLQLEPLQLLVFCN